MDKTGIVILGGGLVQNPDGKWRTTNYEEGDNFGALGDRMRVTAGSCVYKDKPGSIIFALGGKGQLNAAKGAPAVSEVIKQELVKMGVPDKDIFVETDSKTTFEQLRAIKGLALKHGLKKIFIVSNRYHLPRIEAMLKMKELEDVLKPYEVGVIEAEKTAQDHEPTLKNEIESAYRSEAMKNRMAMENKGMEDINKGKYKIK